MSTKIVVFDMDGVIFDSIEESMKTVAKQYPGLTPKMHKELLTGNFHEEIKKITLPKKIETEEEIKIRQEEYSKIKSKSPMYEGIENLLIKLHGLGYILALNTSAFSRNTLPILENSKITHLFDTVATAELSKSKMEKFEMIRDKYTVTEENVLFVTDTLGDLREADEANIPTIIVTWGAHDRSYFDREKHNNLIDMVDTPKELINSIITYFK